MAELYSHNQGRCCNIASSFHTTKLTTKIFARTMLQHRIVLSHEQKTDSYLLVTFMMRVCVDHFFLKIKK